jgi:hypothetical protein
MDVSNLLAMILKEKFENKGSQIGHTKKIILKACLDSITIEEVVQTHCF